MIFCSAKISPVIESEVDSFPNQQKLKECFTNKPVLENEHKDILPTDTEKDNHCCERM